MLSTMMSKTLKTMPRMELLKKGENFVKSFPLQYVIQHCYICHLSESTVPSVNAHAKIYIRGGVFLLKGLSHEIDFKNFDKKLHNLA